ncbi:MAG: histidine kinase dimerization/phospho-acceptor domain-containing protein, partial [Candidatus Micrarchaeota archaeon]
MVALAVFSIIVVGLMSYSLADRGLMDSVEEQLQIRTLFEKAYLENNLVHTTEEVNRLANSPGFLQHYLPIYHCLCSEENICNSSEHNLTKENLKRAVREYMTGYLQYYSLFAAIQLTCPSGDVIISTSEADEGKFVGYDDVFKKGKEGLYFSQPEYDIGAQDTVVRISAPLKDGNETAGILIIITDLPSLGSHAMLSDMPISEETYLVSAFHRFVTTPPDLPERLHGRTVVTEATERCFDAGEGSGVYKNYRGVMVMGHYSLIPSLQSCVISEIEVDEVLEPVFAIRNGIIIFALVLTLLLVFLGFKIVQKQIKPLEDVIKATKEYGKGNFDYHVPVTLEGELGMLGTSINRMADEIKRSHKELSEHSETLERTVKKRTSQLEESLEKQKDARAAMLNMLEDLNEALKKLKTLDVMKDEFLNNAAHELKTPLIPILGYTELALGGRMGKLNKEEVKVLTVIERNAKRLKKLIDEILDISKLESKSMMFDVQRIDIAEVLRDSIQDMQPLAEQKGLYLKLETPKTMEVLGDTKRLTQVVTNLLKNSIKFTDK